MRVYLELVKNAFQAMAAYKMEAVLNLVFGIIWIFPQVAIWRAFSSGSGEIPSATGVVTLREMVTYVVVSEGIFIFIANNVIQKIDSKIRSGEIGMDLIKPLSLGACLFCETVGSSLFQLFFGLLPLMVVSECVFGLDYPLWWNLLLFVVALINGAVIYFLLSYLLGLLGFWYLEVWHFERLLTHLIRLLSGHWIPLWFFPSFLVRLSAFLPFRLIYFVPLEIYLEKVGVDETVVLISQQFAWIGILLIVAKILWTKGVKKLVIQGG